MQGGMGGTREGEGRMVWGIACTSLFSGYGPEESTWEPEANLESCYDILQEFLRKECSTKNNTTNYTLTTASLSLPALSTCTKQSPRKRRKRASDAKTFIDIGKELAAGKVLIPCLSESGTVLGYKFE